MSVKLREDNSGVPGDLVADLTGPASLTANALNTFTAPASTNLDANTTYWLSLHEGVSSNNPSVATTTDTSQSGATDWTIDGRRFKTGLDANWSNSTASLVMEVKGSLTTVEPGVQSAEAAHADGVTTLSLTFDRELGSVAAPEPWDLRYAFSADGLWSDGTRYISMIPNLIETSGKVLTLSYYAAQALPGREVSVHYDEAWATKYLPSQLLYADGEKVARFHQTMTRPTGGAAIPPVLSSAQVAGTTLTLTFDGALDASSAPAGSRFKVMHIRFDWEGASSYVDGTGTAAITNNADGTATVTVTLAERVPQGRFARVAYSRGDAASPLRGDSSGPVVADIWWPQASVVDRDPPQLTGSLLVGTSLVLYYDDRLDTGSVPAQTGSDPFTVAIDVVNPVVILDVNGISVHANAVELTLPSAQTSDVSVGYIAPDTNPVQDTEGNNAANLMVFHKVTRQASDPGAPSFASASSAAAALTVSFDQYLDPAHVPSASAFTLSLSNTDLADAGYQAPTVTDVAVLGTDVELTISPWWYPCDGSLRVTYAKPSAVASRLKNNWGTEANAFSNQTSANTVRDICVFMIVKGSVQPGGQSGNRPRGMSGDLGRTGLRSYNLGDAASSGPRTALRSDTLEDGSQNSPADASADMTQIVLAFGGALNPDTVPGPESFTVTSRTPGAAAVDVTGVETASGADDRLVLSLSRGLAGGERVTVSYRRPHGTSGLWDAQGRQVANFSVDVTAPGAVPNADPAFANGPVSLQVAENTAAGIAIGDPVTAADADADAELTYTLGGADAASFTIDSATGQISTFADLDHESRAAYSVTVTVSDGLDSDGRPDDSADDSVAVSIEVLDVNEAPVFRGWAQRLHYALPGFLVSLHMSESDFSDPDGDPLTFELGASRDDVFARAPHMGLPEGFAHNQRVERVFYLAKTACALAELGSPAGDAFYTVFTMTATDPGGETATATATFRTDPTVFGCPALSSAAVDGTAVTLVLDGGLETSYAEPEARDFEVKADGVAIGVASVGEVSDGDTEISLTLESPVSAGQDVTVSYALGDSAVVAAFTDQPATNNTPAPPETDEAETPEQPEEIDETDETETPACAPDPGGAMVPVCAAVSANQLTLTFNRDLAPISSATARALRWAFLVDGAYHHGNPVNSQSPNQVAVDGNTLTLTLGTAVRPGHDVTVTYWDNRLHDTDGTPLAGFTVTLTTTQRS